MNDLNVIPSNLKLNHRYLESSEEDTNGKAAKQIISNLPSVSSIDKKKFLFEFTDEDSLR